MKTNLKTNSISSIFGSKSNPLIISGPCSAESEDQVVATCTALAKNKNVNLLRAGVWKPRTRPNNFEGHGENALKWLSKAKEITGLPITTEVANAKHVELCLKYNVDMLWVGARTTVNPFAVQEIADALRGTDIPVLVKNPINPDLQLWIGALERINQAGITRLGAIHRGFSTGQPSPFRNDPLWEIALNLKQNCPDIEIICDPSHIAGIREIVPFIAQKAMDLNMDGLMIESHINPAVALSDAKQQIIPSELNKMLSEMIFRSNKTYQKLLTESNIITEGKREPRIKVAINGNNTMNDEIAKRVNGVIR